MNLTLISAIPQSYNCKFLCTPGLAGKTRNFLNSEVSLFQSELHKIELFWLPLGDKK